MKAVVAVRPQPHRVVDADGTAEPHRFQLGIDDRVALEAALEFADRIVAVGIGGTEARQCVRSALERGADRGVHVAFDPIERIAGEKYATVLSRITSRESPEVVFVGHSSSFSGPEIAGLTASRLDWPGATQVTALGAENLAVDVEVGDDEVALQRKLAIGRQEAVAVSLPAVLGIDTGFTDPGRASLPTAIAGRRADLETVDLAEMAPGESRFSMSVGNATVDRTTPNERWGRGRPPRSGTVEERIYRMLGRDTGGSEGAGELIDAPPEEAADQVVAFLRENELL